MPNNFFVVMCCQTKRGRESNRRKMGKKKTLSDILNDQLGGHQEPSDHLEHEDMFAPEVDDFYDDELEDVPSAKLRRLEGDRKKPVPTKGKKLRARGPLDDSFTTGKYAVENVTAGDAEAAVDDIFGMLDEDDTAATGAGLTTEEDYEKWYNEERLPKKRIRSKMGVNAEESDILDQLEQLRERQLAVVSGNDATNFDRAEEARTSNILKDHIVAYSSLLRVRVKLQPLVTKFLQFPQYYSLPTFVKQESGIAAACKAVRADLRSVWDDLTAVASRLDCGADQFSTQVKDQTLTDMQKRLDKFHANVMQQAEECIAEWSSKIVQPNAAKLKSVNQPLVDQIRAIIAAKTRLLARAQKNRNHIKIFGHPSHMKASNLADRAASIAEGDLDDEIFDDGDFVRELVHRSGAAAAKLEAMWKEAESAANAATPAGAHGSKSGFHRKTKGKAVNYEPRPKLVGFMVRIPYRIGDQHDAMMSSLFK